ncbi:hypothetical protein KNJ79_02125 [Sphingopyxis indica]|uniref:hypothetical protein n=1 Tax=Sphingopyxis indica TaxID=436663 RepID=UPI002938E060|nr:hypothetical protein [Sphingopyxis indica]WOF43783.1 hypothetical protein KNJ79_02125 [Sphingopyxis indica]
MARSHARKKNKGKRVAAGEPMAGNVHPLIAQAKGNGARLDRGEYEVTTVANPYGKEVVVRDQVHRHKAVRRVPHFETLYRAKVIDRQQFLCLEWYADRAELAQSGLIRCGLDVSGSGGGSVHSHVPASEAALWARRDVDWARGLIPRDCLAAFDSVMVDGVSFIESARRLCAGRYVRVSVRRQRQIEREQFVRAAKALTIGVLPLITEVAEGRIRA